MRKVLAMLMAQGILLSLCACGVSDDARNTENTSTSVSDTTESVTTEETAETTTETTHTHTFRAATCTAPKTCTKCGATEGNPLDVPGKENYHGHVYTGGSSSKKYHYEANCAGKNSHEITWEEVERRGLGPCGTCVLK